MENRIIVKHKHLGTGEILEITYHKGYPLVSTQWDNGRRSCCGVDDLEFLVTNRTNNEVRRTIKEGKS